MKLLSKYIPRALPTGLIAFNTWVANIIKVSGLPDNASTRGLAARFIMALPSNRYYLSYHEISKQLIKAAAMQVSSQVIKDAQTPPPTLTVEDNRANVKTTQSADS